MTICDVCGYLTDKPEVHPGMYGLLLVCPLCAAKGAVTHLAVVPDGGEGYSHDGGSGTVRR